jgi:uncharacterized protein (TIGR03437 family)
MRFTHKLFPMILAVLLAAPALPAQNAAQVTHMEIAAAGALSGTPAAGSQSGYNPQFKVTDSISATATTTLTPTINAAQSGTSLSTPVTATITEYPLPTTGNFPDRCSSNNAVPLRIAAGPDGALWFTESNSNKIGRITTSGSITEYCIPTADATPQGITAGPDGGVWFTEYANKVGRIDPTSHVITEFPISTISQPGEITAGPDGNLWFTTSANVGIGRITTAGQITLFNNGSNQGAITAGPDGNLWFTTSDIWKITTAGVYTEITATGFELDTPTWITPGSDGALWYVGQNSNNIHRVTTAGAVNVNETIPTPRSSPFAIVAGADGALWFTEAGGNKIGRITTAGIITNEFKVPTDSAAPLGIAAGSDGSLWFVESGANQIGRLVLATPAQINSGGVVNNASYNLGAGTNLTDGTSCLPPACNPAFGSDGKLGTTMAGAQVTVNSTPVPIFYAVPTQLGIQIPFEVTGTSATVSVSVAGQASTPATVTLAPVSPGIFTATADGKGAGAITHVDGSAVTTQNPAHPGEVVILYATGLGQVAPAVPTGALPASLSSTFASVTLTIGGITFIPDFAGLSGCCVGLNQINARVPLGVSSGNAVPVVLNIGGKSSNTATIAVQ